MPLKLDTPKSNTDIVTNDSSKKYTSQIALSIVGILGLSGCSASIQSHEIQQEQSVQFFYEPEIVIEGLKSFGKVGYPYDNSFSSPDNDPDNSEKFDISDLRGSMESPVFNISLPEYIPETIEDKLKRKSTFGETGNVQITIFQKNLVQIKLATK